MGTLRAIASVCVLLSLAACSASNRVPAGDDAATQPDTVTTDDVVTDDVVATDDVVTTDDVVEKPDVVMPVDVPVGCPSGQHQCDGVCLSNTSTETCGARCTPCPLTTHARAVCVAATCQLVCDDGYHRCGSQCLSDSDVRSCGSSCTPCLAPLHGTATCAGGACSIACDAGYLRNGDLCVPTTCPAGQRLCGTTCRTCPSAGVETTRCDATNACVAETCASGYRLLGSSCVAITCASTARLCAGACASCPTSGVATTQCNGAECAAATCATGYMLAMGRCEAITCAAGQRLCGSTCATCPTASVRTTSCSAAGACVATACDTGYTVQPDGSCAPMACAAGRRFCVSACAVCPTTGVATTACNAAACVAATCAAGYRLNASGACEALSCTSTQRACGSTCATCPTDGVTTTACGAGDTCVATACSADYTLTAGACVPNACPGGGRSCGGVCRTCPTANVATTMCSGPACLAATCNDGYGVVGGACVAMTCGAGTLYCLSGCAACPTTGAATTGCQGSSCVARTCAAGYTLLSDSPDGLPRCVANGWSLDLVSADSSASSTQNAALALDATGRPVVAFFAYPWVALATRTATGWSRVNVVMRTTAASLTTVRRLAVDALGNAHIIFRDFKQITSFDSTYGWYYVRVAPDGTASTVTELADERRMYELDGFGLAVDAAGDAHIAYTTVPATTYASYYRRTYMGAWLAPVAVSSTVLGACAIAVNAAGDDVHIACVERASQIGYVHGAASVFGAAVTTSVSGRSFDDAKVYATAGGAAEVWARDDRSFFSTSVTGAAFAAVAPWGTFTDRASYVYGARGPTDHASLEQASTSAMVVFRRGPAAGPGAPVNTNLPLLQLLPGLSVDGSGNVFGLGRRTGSSSGRQNLYLIRGR